MKALAILFLIPFAFACIEINSSEVQNTSFSMAYGECYHDIISNLTYQAPNATTLLYNDTINMTAYQISTDNNVNRSYICNYDYVGDVAWLDFNATYHNNNHDITVHAPAYPTIPACYAANSVISLVCGNNYTNTNINLTILTTFPQLNSNISLDANSSYTYAPINLTVNANPLPNLAINKSLTYGGSYINEALGIYITGADFPLVHEAVSITSCGYNKNYAMLDLNISSTPCDAKTISLNFGESYKCAFENTIINAPAKKNEVVALGTNQNKTWSDVGISASCSIGINEIATFCKNTGADTYKSVWNMMNLSNYTCQTPSYQCMDNVTELCTVDEKYKDFYGVIRCLNRVTEESFNKTLDSNAQLSQCTSDKNGLQKNIDTNTAVADKNSDNIVMAIGGLVLLACMGAGFYVYAKNEKKKEGER